MEISFSSAMCRYIYKWNYAPEVAWETTIRTIFAQLYETLTGHGKCSRTFPRRDNFAENGTKLYSLGLVGAVSSDSDWSKVF